MVSKSVTYSSCLLLVLVMYLCPLKILNPLHNEFQSCISEKLNFQQPCRRPLAVNSNRILLMMIYGGVSEHFKPAMPASSRTFLCIHRHLQPRIRYSQRYLGILVTHIMVKKFEHSITMTRDFNGSNGRSSHPLITLHTHIKS